MGSRARANASALGLLLALASCGEGFAVNVTIRYDTQVSDATLATVQSIELKVSGDDTYARSVTLGHAPKRTERITYLPSDKARTIDFTIAALDGNGIAIASGTSNDVTLSPGKTKSIEVDLGPTVPTDASVQHDAGVDLESGDAGTVVTLIGGEQISLAPGWQVSVWYDLSNDYTYNANDFIDPTVPDHEKDSNVPRALAIVPGMQQSFDDCIAVLCGRMILQIDTDFSLNKQHVYNGGYDMGFPYDTGIVPDIPWDMAFGKSKDGSSEFLLVAGNSEAAGDGLYIVDGMWNMTDINMANNTLSAFYDANGDFEGAQDSTYYSWINNASEPSLSRVGGPDVIPLGGWSFNTMVLSSVTHTIHTIANGGTLADNVVELADVGVDAGNYTLKLRAPTTNSNFALLRGATDRPPNGDLMMLAGFQAAPTASSLVAVHIDDTQTTYAVSQTSDWVWKAGSIPSATEGKLAGSLRYFVLDTNHVSANTDRILIFTPPPN